MTAPPAPDATPRRSLGQRLLPLAGLALILVLFFAFRLDRYISFATLRDNRAAVTEFVTAHAVLAPLLFIVTYIVVIAASLPIGAVLSVTGGFLFGSVVGTICVLLGATTGATALFLAARTAIGDSLKRRLGAAGEHLARELEGNAFGYLLVLRLVPLFPFVVVNLVPALVGIPLRAYVAATFLGIIPASFVYVSIGSGLGALFDRNETPDVAAVAHEALIPLLGLATLALIPVVYRRFKTKQPA